MYFENLKSRHPELLQFLNDKDYSATVIRNITNEIKNILENAEHFGWKTYRDVYHTYEEDNLSKDVLRGKRHCLRMIKRFDIQGEFPDRTRRSYAFESDAYENLPDDFKGLIEFYRVHDTGRGKRQTTIYHEALNTMSFLCAMQKRGCSELDEIEEKDVLSFFLSDAGKLIRGCSYKKNVAAVFKAGLHWKKEPCSRILTFLPALRENRKTIQYLTEEETNRIRDALRNTEAQLSLRDRAVGTLLLYTGLRGCDIAGLLFESIDWDREIQMSWIHKEYGRALLGMAHGNAGIALAYGKLYEITGEFKYADRLEKVILYEHRRYNERTGDWYDYRKPEEIRETHEDAAAWCHGAGGILSSRLELKKINLSEGLQEILDVDIKRAVERVKGHFMQVDVYLYLQLFANGQN